MNLSVFEDAYKWLIKIMPDWLAFFIVGTFIVSFVLNETEIYPYKEYGSLFRKISASLTQTYNVRVYANPLHKHVIEGNVKTSPNWPCFDSEAVKTKIRLKKGDRLLFKNFKGGWSIGTQNHYHGEYQFLGPDGFRIGSNRMIRNDGTFIGSDYERALPEQCLDETVEKGVEPHAKLVYWRGPYGPGFLTENSPGGSLIATVAETLGTEKHATEANWKQFSDYKPTFTAESSGYLHLAINDSLNEIGFCDNHGYLDITFVRKKNNWWDITY